MLTHFDANTSAVRCKISKSTSNKTQCKLSLYAYFRPGQLRTFTVKVTDFKMVCMSMHVEGRLGPWSLVT